MIVVAKKLSEKQLIDEKISELMLLINKRCGFYRENPHRFCKDYLNINLKKFQKILMYALFHNNYFMYVASRGQGKTWLTAIFCVAMCILYPGTKIVIASATISQGNELLLKIIDDLCKNYDWGSNNLNNEIEYHLINQNKGVIKFHNGSWIRTATASDNSRGMRANILIVDEVRMVSLDVINTVLRRFLTAPRTPSYLNNAKYSHLIERNKEIYMTSAWYKSHWIFDKFKSYVANLLDDTKKYFVCDLPYQISIKEGLLSREQVEDEMSEMDFDETKFMIEMEGVFFGSTNGAFFNFEDIDKRRKIKQIFYPLPYYIENKSKIPDLANGERRIMSVDVALLASKKHNNDASAIVINSCVPSGENSFISNIMYIDTYEGLNTDELGIIIMRLFNKYKCTDLVLDTLGVGLGVYDFIIKNQYDTETGETYRAMTCHNDSNMASRCKDKNALKCVWSIKANANLNTEMCVLLRNGFKQGKINLPVSEFVAEEHLKESIKGFNKMSIREQSLCKLPYIQTSAMINELINLEHEIKSSNIKIKEKSGMRKDRYSSLAYNYWVACQIELNNKPKNKEKNIVDLLPIKTAKKASWIG